MSASRPDASRARRRLSPEERRAELLDAAAALAVDAGDLAAATLERVARAAGCSRNLVYRYFGSHDGLIDALAEHQRRLVLASLGDIDDTTSMNVWAHEVAAALLAASEGRGQLLVMLFERGQAVADRSERQFLVAVLVARLRAAGVSPARAQVLAPMLGAMLFGAVVAKVVAGASDRRVLAEVDRAVAAWLPPHD